MRFTTPTHTISVTSKSKIAPGQAAFNLYMLHQAGWVPTYPNANRDTIGIGAADAAEFLVGK